MTLPETLIQRLAELGVYPECDEWVFISYLTSLPKTTEYHVEFLPETGTVLRYENQEPRIAGRLVMISLRTVFKNTLADILTEVTLSNDPAYEAFLTATEAGAFGLRYIQ